MNVILNRTPIGSDPASPAPSSTHGGEGVGAKGPAGVKGNMMRRLKSGLGPKGGGGGDPLPNNITSAADLTHDAMGTKWSKGLWDNMESKYSFLKIGSF